MKQKLPQQRSKPRSRPLEMFLASKTKAQRRHFSTGLLSSCLNHKNLLLVSGLFLCLPASQCLVGGSSYCGYGFNLSSFYQLNHQL